MPSNQRRRELSASGEVRTMSIVMPPPDAGVLARRADIVRALRSIVPGEGVIEDVDALRPYESDGLTAYRQPPMVVVLPETTEQVSRILAWCHAEGVKVVPRGSGTSLRSEEHTSELQSLMRSSYAVFCLKKKNNN